jgi:hypothetical protein
MQVATVGLDVAKQVFQVHGARPAGRAPRHRPERPGYGDGKLACVIIEDGEDGRRDQIGRKRPSPGSATLAVLYTM